jgi:LacI family transcriptional regulator
LRISGIHVPEEMAVVGFDDQNLAQFMSPPLTTVHVPSEEVGQVAACQLLNLIKNEPFERMTLLPTEIVIRRSCGCSWNTVADNL